MIEGIKVTTFDVTVIGSGSGLNVSSDVAVDGLSVTVVEEGPFGGTCLNPGRVRIRKHLEEYTTRPRPFAAA